MEKWCEHIRYETNCWLFTYPGNVSCLSIGEKWVRCPICECPRPKRQTLAEVLKDTWFENKAVLDPLFYEKLATAARKFIEEEKK